MSNLTPESANGAAGSNGTPTPEVSSQPSGQPASSAAIGLDDAFVEKLLANPKVDEYLTRKFQSAKDRRIGNLEKTVADLKAGKATPAQVRQAVVELEGEQPAGVAPGSATPAAQGVDEMKRTTAQILAKAGIAENDPELLALVAAMPKVDSPADWYVAVGGLAAKRNAAPPVTAADAVMDGNGASAGTRTKEEQRAAISKELNALQLVPGKKDIAKITALQAKLRGLLGA